MPGLLPGVTYAQGHAPWSRLVITASDIRRAGILRVGELVRLAPDAAARTVDEFTWRLGEAVGAQQDDRLVVTVDGQLVEPSLLGVTSLSRLPLDIGSIDSVVFTSGAAGDAVARTGARLMRIYSRRGPRRAWAATRFVTGSETGDPGPYAFLPPSAPNQDRFGHDAAVSAGGTMTNWSVAAGLGFGVHIATDPATFDRLLASGAGFPRLEYVTPSLRLEFDSPRATHRVLVGRSRVDDWLRVEAIGLEAPGRTELDHAGLSGELRQSSGNGFSYAASIERSTADLRTTPASPELEIERSTAHLEVTASASAGRLGAAASRRRLTSNELAEDDSYTALRAFADVDLPMSAGGRYRVAASVDVGLDRISPALDVGGRWNLGASEIGLTLEAAEDLGRPHDGLWPLVARGFGWVGASGITATGTASERRRRAAVRVHWFAPVSPVVTLSVDGMAELQRLDALPVRELDFVGSLTAWRGPVRIVDGARGRVASLAPAVHWRSSRMELVARAELHVVGGDPVVRTASRTVPKRRARLDATWRPVRSLAVLGAVAVRSSTRWDEYVGGASRSLPGAAIVDMGLRKTLWNGRIGAQLGLRNLFDAVNRLHPEGADARLSGVLMLEGELGGRPSVR